MPLRLILGLPIAAAIVVFLFLVMNGMIMTDELPEVELRESPEITLPKVTDDPEEVVEPPQPPTMIDPPEQPVLDPGDPLDPPTITTEGPGRPTGPGGGTTIPLPPIDREKTPLVRVDPTNFERCFDSGTSGSERVRLKFDITPQGETTNIEIVSSSDSCFERSARRAVEQWRYAPEMEKGEPVWFYGAEATIIYQVGE